MTSSTLDETITSPDKPTTHRFDLQDEDDDLLSSPSLAGRHSTPRMPATGSKSTSKKAAGSVPRQPAFAENFSSPYEALRQEVTGKVGGKAKAQPITPGKSSALPDMSMTPDTSPFNPHDVPASALGTNNQDTILHQGILNRTFRVQATPHTARKTTKMAATPQTANRTRRILDFEDTMSSPLEEAPAPRLHGVFSPMKAPRTPGASVVTPGIKKRFEERRGRESNAGAEATLDITRGRTGGNLTSRSVAAWDSDSEDDDDLGMSPPKTIMFNLPDSRVMQTPGKFYFDVHIQISDSL